MTRLLAGRAAWLVDGEGTQLWLTILYIALGIVGLIVLIIVVQILWGVVVRVVEFFMEASEVSQEIKWSRIAKRLKRTDLAPAHLQDLAFRARLEESGELLESVGAHPNAYPELKAWIGEIAQIDRSTSQRKVRKARRPPGPGLSAI